MSIWGSLAFLLASMPAIFGGAALVRNARKLGNATIDFEASGPLRTPASHTGETSRSIEAASYNMIGGLLVVIGVLLAGIGLARFFYFLLNS